MRTLQLSGKCSDLCFTIFNDGEKEYKQDGYPPNIKGLARGDYVDVTINLDTGKIINWTVPTNEEIKKEMDIKDFEEDKESDEIDNDPYFNDLIY
jgi:hypothetical protein